MADYSALKYDPKLSEKPNVIPAPETYIERNVSWVFKGKQWTWKYSIPKSVALEYAEKTRRSSFSSNQDYVNGLIKIVEFDNLVLNDISNTLAAAAKKEGFDYYETIGFFAAFVQGVINYEKDSAQFGCQEYIQYPIELLVNSKGDCEDKSTLLANLLAIQKYNGVLLFIPLSETEAHLGYGVQCSTDYPGYSYTISGKKYCYLESTAKGWKLGAMPSEYKQKIANYAIVPVSK